jgi:hypothetical protein
VTGIFGCGSELRLQRCARPQERSRVVPNDFVQQKKVEAFFQATLQTHYMHGLLNPRLTYIQNVRGTYAIHPSLTYRWSDSLLLSTELIHIGGEYQSFGFFQDRDQLAFRVTYHLN